MKPITVYGHISAPNPWKVATVLKELSLPYDWHNIDFSDVKASSYTSINPNGRLPAIQDPNTGVTLWESGAIILYLIEQYDKDGKISNHEGLEKYQCQQWLFFQVSGQGPYFGQATWFARFHPERIQSATDRYLKEIDRVTMVLDKALEGKDWLVGEKCTFADLSFITWANIGKGLMAQLGKADTLDKYPNYGRWMEALSNRQTVKEVAEEVAAGRKALGLPE